MHREQRGCRGELHEEIAVTDTIHRVLRDPGIALGIGESKEHRDGIAIDGQGGTGECTGTQGTDIGAFAAIGETTEVAIEHLYIGEEMMGEGDRLGALKVGVAGDDDGGIPFSESDKGALEGADLLGEGVEFVAEPESDIDGDLIIAAAGGVEFGTGWDAPGELGLDVHVDILELGLPMEGAGLDLLSDGLEAGADGLELGLGEDADLLEHGGVGDRAADVLTPEPPIEGDRFGEGGDIGGRTAGEAAGTGNG